MERKLNHFRLPQCLIAITLAVFVISTLPISSQGATGAQLATATNSVNSAFSSVHYAEQNGGDVSSLVEKLNTAILLIQKAVAENATNPNAATADLSNATDLAQMVSQDSSSVSASGVAAHQLRLYEMIGTIGGAVSIAALAYLRGDRVYRRLWLYVYRNHVVKNKDE